MSPAIVPSDSYARYLSLPSLPPAPEHVRNLLPEYKITHILGTGGFAKVYRAIGHGGKKVALKIPKTDDIFETMDVEVINRFKSEAELWMRLEHPNIVALHSGKTEPLPHMAMELMEGGNLKQLMKNHTLTVGEAVHIMEQVLKGLSFAHRMASVHRDLKPENILFTSDGVAKITDWGIGKFMASAGKSQSVGIKGTLDYCAPEQYDRREYGKVDWQTDIFQMGVMFYEMLTGENPFEGEDFADCMGKVLRYSPEPPSSINPEIPEELNDVILGAIKKKKENRWDSGAVMLNELRRVISGKKSKEDVIKQIESKQKEAEELANEGRLHEALDVLNTVLNIKPGHPPALNDKGTILFELGESEKALMLYDMALESDPKIIDTWTNKGLALHHMGNLTGAFYCYERALALNPNNTEVLSSIGALYFEIDKYDKAMKYFERATGIKPNDPDLWYFRGFTNEVLERWHAALTCYNEVLRLKPFHEEALFGRDKCRGMKRGMRVRKRKKPRKVNHPPHPHQTVGACSPFGLGGGLLRLRRNHVNAASVSCPLGNTD